MQFPATDGNNLILVQALNNSGMTSVIRAMRFLFSGRLPETTTERLHELIHDGTKQTTATGSQATGWVEFTMNRRTLTKRGKPVAQVTPPPAVKPRKIQWPDFAARLPGVYVLHVATALTLGAKVLLTFDSDQAALAKADGLKVKL